MTDEEKRRADELVSRGLDNDAIARETGQISTYLGRKKARENLIRPSGAPSPEGKAFEEPDQAAQDRMKRMNDETRMMIVQLIRDMLDVLKRLYGI